MAITERDEERIEYAFVVQERSIRNVVVEDEKIESRCYCVYHLFNIQTISIMLY